MQKISPFLWFDDQAEEAAHFYTSIFKDSQVNSITHFGNDVPGPKNKVMIADFQLYGTEFMALNGGPMFSITPAISFFVYCHSEEEIDRLWNQLSKGGKTLMELDRYPFSEKFGWLVDRYGVSWQLNITELPRQVAPFFLFTGDQAGKAEEAIEFYTAIFKDSSVNQMERFGKDQGEPEGNVMHARFTLAGQEFMAMDSTQEHNFTFTPATSFYVNCKGQEEVDYFWDRLSMDGEKSQCGWLKDKFGVSWQIVPEILPVLMNDPNVEKARRVTQAMLEMNKIDIAGLQEAYDRAGTAVR